MSKRINIIIASTIIFVIAAFFSCKKSDFSYNSTTTVQPCKNIACANGGVCDNGYCSCPNGFEGPSCELKWNARYIGNYIATDHCDDSTTLSATVSANNLKPDGIILQNIIKSCPDVALSATIGYEKTSFTIPLQRVCDSIYISGKGSHTLSKDYINIFLEKRDSINHTTTPCSIELRLK